jgi:hypothetical protein
MNNVLKRILESRDTNLYKKLVAILGEYTTSIPCTGIDDLFDSAIKHGAKILPKDKRALDILDHILSCDSTARVIHKLLNLRFSDLPAELKPISKVGRRHQVVHWTRGANVTDRVKDLINWEGSSAVGKWTNVDGEIVALIDIAKEEEK